MQKKRSSKSTSNRPLKNPRRNRPTFSEMVSSANRRAHEKANRRAFTRGDKYIWAAIATADSMEEDNSTELLKRMVRWTFGMLLLPLCWVTTWTFLSRFSQAAMYEDFWKTTEFWYFIVGALLMGGWFWSGLLQTFFLYLYVLGHELTHAVFVLLCRGKVTDFHVSAEGGYITTNKTNLIIALSPYFVPFWAVVVAVIYGALRYFAGLGHQWDQVFYALMGVTWTFHMAWTLWMIPRDQPDLRENGTFLSLVVIYLANLLVLAGLLCVAAESPLRDTRQFGKEWIRNAATSGDVIFRHGNQLVEEVRRFGKF